MDMRMPEMDGLDATRAIRALGGPRAATPIIALTANAFPDDMKACRDAGMNEFIPKPIRRKTLVEKLSVLLVTRLLATGDKTPRLGSAAPIDRAATLPADVALTDLGPILDRAIFDELADDISAEGVRATLDVFTADTVARLALLRQLSCDTDRARITLEAHTLNGASGLFGLRQLSHLAQALEHAAPVITPGEYSETIDRLDAAFKVARDVAERLYASVAA
jgi:CheY-like chemotaxis protein